MKKSAVKWIAVTLVGWVVIGVVVNAMFERACRPVSPTKDATAARLRRAAPTPPSSPESTEVVEAPKAPVAELPPAPRKTIRDGAAGDFSAKAAKDRSTWIDKAQADNILGDVRVANHVGKMVCGPKFFLADFKQRQSFASVVYAWCLDIDPDCELLLLRDYRTNKDIGRYNGANGGLKMD